MITGRTNEGGDVPDWVALEYDGRHRRVGLIRHSIAVDGRFRISGAPAGRCSVVLHMQMPGGAGKVTSVLAKDLYVKPGGVSRIEVDAAELFPTRRVRVMMDGQPVVGATCKVELQTVQKSDTPAPLIATAVTTDEKGYCTFQAPIGDYRMITRIPGFDNPCVAIATREDGELVARISYRRLTLKIVCEGFQDFVAGRRFTVRTATGDYFEVRPGANGVVECRVPTDAAVMNVDILINMRRDWSLFAGGIIELSTAEKRLVEGARGHWVLLGRPAEVSILNKRSVTFDVRGHLFR